MRAWRSALKRWAKNALTKRTQQVLETKGTSISRFAVFRFREGRGAGSNSSSTVWRRASENA